MPTVVYWADVGGGTEHYRCRTPGAALTRRGFDVRHWEDDGSDLRADVVVLQRVVRPGTPDLIAALQAHGIRVVYDIDDLYDAIPAYNPASVVIDPATIALLHDCLRRADLITVSTPELAEHYSRFGETVVLPNYLDPDTWAAADGYRVPRTRLHVGWMGHAAYRSADLDLLRPWMRDWLNTRPDVRFVVAGSDRSVLDGLGVGGLVCPPETPGTVRPYAHLPAMLAQFDVGLVPLARNKFNDCKSHAKGLEYSAVGVPVVASPSREYQSFVRPGVNGELVRSRDWVSAIEAVLGDLNGYRRGAIKVAAEYQIDDHIDRWVDAYTGRR